MSSIVATKPTETKTDGMDVSGVSGTKNKKRKRLGTRDLSFRTSTNTSELIKRNKRLVCQLSALKLRCEQLELFIRIARKELAESFKADASYKRNRKTDSGDAESDDEGTIYDDVIDSVYGFEEGDFDDQ